LTVHATRLRISVQSYFKAFACEQSFTIEELKCAGEAKANKNAGVCQVFGKTSDFFPQNP
jgi:hypothetical protein